MLQILQFLGFLLLFSAHYLTDANMLTTESTTAAPSVFVNHPTPTQTYNHKVKLDYDGKYWLFWNTNSTHVTMEVNVQVTGLQMNHRK